MLGRAYF